MPSAVTRHEVLAYRVGVQQLTRHGGSLADTAVLDLGVQDTGPGGALWALAVRGVDVTAHDLALQAVDGPLSYLWTLRGAPHAYRRVDLPSVAAAVAPFSASDAAKRLLSAAKPLRAAGIGPLEALDATAAAMREIVTAPMPKGEVSTRLAAAMPEPYLRWCGVCGATHVYELPFRLAAVRAGLELQPGTSPPVLRPIEMRGGSGRRTSRPGFVAAPVPLPRHDVVRAALHLLGPATPKLIAGFLDAPVKDVAQRWPGDVVEVSVAGEPRSMLEADVEGLTAALPPTDEVRLLGPYDLFLQVKDRDLLVADAARAKVLWPVLGRPGAVLAGGEVIGAWRPKAVGKRLTVIVRPWAPVPRRTLSAVEAQASRLAVFRGLATDAATVAVDD